MSDVETATGGDGRVFTFRKVGVVQQARILRAIGPAQSDNAPYVNMVFEASMVSDIDGVPLPFPTNERQIDTMIDKVGDAGFAMLIVRRLAAQKKFMDDAEKAMEGAEAPTDPLVVSASL